MDEDERADKMKCGILLKVSSSTTKMRPTTNVELLATACDRKRLLMTCRLPIVRRHASSNLLRGS